MKITARSGNPDIATVYLADFGAGRTIEFVESIQPPIPREDKWVLIVSTLAGCPVGCSICDAGESYSGKLTEDELWDQLDYLVNSRYPDGRVPAGKFKIQFARMGEPAFNPAVIKVLQQLPSRYAAPGLMPSLSTVAPAGTDRFFEQLLEVKKANYQKGNFQLQFSLHSTDQEYRDRLIPVKKWLFADIASYGSRFYRAGDRRITLNFVLTDETPFKPVLLKDYFDPDIFLIKLTPLNPTYRSRRNRLESRLDPYDPVTAHPVIAQAEAAGYKTILSIGEPEENLIGSNCGQYVQTHLRSTEKLADGYNYTVLK